jgi:hypothetical protein
MGQSFRIAAAPRQRSHSQVRVSRDWPHSRLPQTGGPGHRIYIPQRQAGPIIYAQAPRSLSVAFYDSQGYGGGIWPHLHTGLSQLSLNFLLRSTVQSTSPSWNKAPMWGLRTDFYYCQTVAGLLIWGALFDERTDLSFTISAGPRQHSHSRVPLPWDSGPYFTVLDSSQSYFTTSLSQLARVPRYIGWIQQRTPFPSL